MTDKELIQALRVCPHIEDCNAAADRLEALIAENEHLREATKMLWYDAEHEVPIDENQCVLALVSGMYENLEKHSAIYFHNACEIATYNDRDGWMFCDTCIHEKSLRDMFAPVTIADHIRAMSDEELAAWLYELDGRDLQTEMPFCPCTCSEKGLESDEITNEMCKRCLVAKLQQPYESEGTP